MTPNTQDPALTIESIDAYPLPGMNIPGSLRFSPDGRWLTYLYSAERGLVREAYAMDIETGETRLVAAPPQEGKTEANLSLEDIFRRERARQRELGITQFFWSSRGDRILFPIRGDIYIQDGVQGSMRLLAQGGSHPIITPQFSPDGQWVAYVQNAEIYVIPAAGGEPRQLTIGARETGKTHGLAEYIAQEEMHRSLGFWWSPDSRQVAFQEVDESHIPVYRIVHQGKDIVGENAQEDHHYPFAGKENARVRLGVVPVVGGEVTWLPMEPEDEYLARVRWLPDGALSAQWLNRTQSSLKLVRYDFPAAARTTLVHETSGVWINLHDIFHPLKPNHPRYPGAFLWASEGTGFQHLYLHSADGRILRMLTYGKWMVEELVGVDPEKDLVYFMGTKHGPLEKHLYVVSLEGGEPVCLSEGPGIHSITLNPAMDAFVDIYHSLDTPPILTLRSLENGRLLKTLFSETDDRIAAWGLTPPQIVQLENRSKILLYGAIYRPPARFGPGPHPAIVYVYGGPHNQQVSNSWALVVNMRAQYLRSLGYLVFVLDNRGSARRGLAFEGTIRHHMGDYEVQDQVDGVRWLVERGLVDPQRVGIYGWSYGGYMAAMCLARAPEVFRAAMAGAPVTHWDGYDTCYTERYMGLPQENPEGYRQSSVMAHADNIRGSLLLVHGMLDENVHFRHTARLVNALNHFHIPYELLIFPDERHLPRRLDDRVYAEKRIIEFFNQALDAPTQGVL